MPPPRSRKADRHVARIAAVINGGPRHSGRSPLFLWMLEHYDQLTAAVTGVGRPDWISATEEFARLGLTKREGEKLNAALVRKTWSRVVQVAEAQRTGAQRAGAQRARGAGAPPARPRSETSPQVAPGARDDPRARDDEEPAPSFGFVRGKDK